MDGWGSESGKEMVSGCDWASEPMLSATQMVQGTASHDRIRRQAESILIYESTTETVKSAMYVIYEWPLKRMWFNILALKCRQMQGLEVCYLFFMQAPYFQNLHSYEAAGPVTLSDAYLREQREYGRIGCYTAQKKN